MSEIDEILKAVLSDNKTDKSTSDEAGQTDNEEKFTTDTESDDIFGGINIDMFMKIGEIMSKMSEQDKNTELLLALKPRPDAGAYHLHAGRHQGQPVDG